jgi:hypothetical protein
MAASKPSLVNADPARAQGVLGQVIGEAEGVIELERGLAGQLIALAQRAGRLVEQLEPVGQRAAELHFLALQRFLDQRLGAAEFGIGLAHFGHQRGTRRCINGSFAPSRCAWRMARRMIRRST